MVIDVSCKDDFPIIAVHSFIEAAGLFQLIEILHAARTRVGSMVNEQAFFIHHRRITLSVVGTAHNRIRGVHTIARYRFTTNGEEKTKYDYGIYAFHDNNFQKSQN
ncbi:MAG: hypothetical protein AB7D92_08160 [Sphaerochaeta sp.]